MLADELAMAKKLPRRRTIFSQAATHATGRLVGGSSAMCDLAFINLLREKVRQQETEDKRAAAFGAVTHGRFVPWSMPAQSQPRSVPAR
jgi:hypothetical protein